MPAVSFKQALKSKLALQVSRRFGDKEYILYDVAALMEAIEHAKDVHLKKKKDRNLYPDWDIEEKVNETIYRRMDDIIVAMMFVGRTSPSGTQYNVPNVVKSAAKSGYGPLMYDLVMFLEGGLTSDKGSVSSDAKDVWTFYKNNRKDVKKLPLDDIEDPKTPPKIDDSSLYSGGGKNPLNYVYKMTKTPNVDALFDNHKAAKSILRKYGIELDEFALDFFDKKY